MALGADLNVDLRLRGTGNEFVAAVASYLALIVLGLDALLHDKSPQIMNSGSGMVCPARLNAVISKNSN